MSKLKTGEVLRRDVRLSRESADEEKRTVEIAISSEAPVERYFGIEILDHSEGSVRLGRLADGGAVLVGHNPDDHVGVVESLRLDDDRVLRGVVRFGRSARASEVFQDVIDGIRTKISVGYVIHRFERTRGEGNAPDEYRAIDWEPYETSFVSIPADTTVGVGRSGTPTGHDTPKEELTMSEHQTEQRQEPQSKPEAPKAPTVNIKAEREQSRENERQRVNAILQVADEHDMSDLGRQAIDEGKSVAEFQREVLAEIGKRNNQIRRESPTDDTVDLTDKEKKRYSLLNVMRAAAADFMDPANARKVRERAAFEMEVGEAAAKKLGITPRGIYIPHEIAMAERADLSAGTATDGAELVATNLLAGSFIDVLRNSMTVMQAGARMITGLVGDVDIPKKTSGSAASWISAEDGDASQSDPQFGTVSMTPHDLAVFTQVTRRLFQQSTPGIDALVRDDLVQGVRTALDLACLYGSGVAGQPAGLGSTSGINSVTFAGSQPTYAEVVQMITETKIDNADRGTTAFITDPNGWDAAMTTEKATNTAQFIWNEATNTVVGRRALVSNQVTAGDWWFGNWNDFLIGFWGGLELNVDPYTHSLKGKIRYVVFQTADLAVRHAVSFVRGNNGSTP